MKSSNIVETLNSGFFSGEVFFLFLFYLFIMIILKNFIELCNSLLNSAIKGTWPVSCSIHKYPFLSNSSKNHNFNQLQINEKDIIKNNQEKNNYLHNQDENNNLQNFKDFSSNYLSYSSFLVNTCKECQDSLLIKNPEIFKIIIQFIGKTITKENNLEKNINGYIYIIKTLIFLTTILPYNQEKIASIGNKNFI